MISQSHESIEDSSKLAQSSVIEENSIDINNSIKTKEKYVELGNKAEKEFKHNEALSFYEKALQLKPLDIQVITQKALCLCKCNKLTEAISYIDDLISMYPNDMNYICIKGECYLYENKPNEALKLFNACLTKDFLHERSRLLKGKCLLEIKEMNEAEKVLNDIIYIYPRNKEGNFLLGLCYYEEKNYREAIKVLQKAYDLQFKNSKLLFALAHSYENVGNFKKACEYYEYDITSSPSYETYFRLGNCYHQRKLYQKAILNCHLSSVLNEKYEEALKLKLDSLLNIKPLRYQDSIDCCLKMLEIDSHNIKTHLTLANIYLQQKSYEEAKAILNQANNKLKKDPQNKEVYTSKIKGLLRHIDELTNPDGGCCCSHFN